MSINNKCCFFLQKIAEEAPVDGLPAEGVPTEAAPAPTEAPAAEAVVDEPAS